MPARALLPSLALGAVGLLLLAWLMLRKRDPLLAACRGPRWRQRLVTAGLLLLATLGYSPPSAGGPPPRRRPAASAIETEEWKQIEATRVEAEAIAGGKRGPYPFDQAGKKKMLERLTAAQALVDKLQQAGKLDAGTAGLLKLDLQTVSFGVARKRATEQKMTTCYRPMLRTPARDSYYRLAQRMPLLEQLARTSKLQPGVLAKVLAGVEQDLAQVGDGKTIAHLDAKQAPRAREVVRRVRASMARIKRQLGR